MQTFKDFISEDLVSSVKAGIEKYKTRKLSGHYDISHAGDGAAKFTHKKANPGSPSYHTSHVRSALSKNRLKVGEIEHHDDGFTMHMTRM